MSDFQIAEIIIETVDTVRQRYFLQKMLESGIPMGFIGPTGTGKSAIINHFLLTLPETKYILNTINFSAQTTANVTQEMVMSRLEKLVTDYFCRLRFGSEVDRFGLTS